MTKKNTGQNSRKNVTNQLKKASMALDDIVWVLQKLNLSQLKEASDLLRASLENDPATSPVAKSYQSNNQNKHFLIGVLPRLFQDRQLFPQNQDIGDFAAETLNLEMSRSHKLSREEIIGKVVCETDSLDDAELSTLVKSLEQLVGDKDKLAIMAEKKRTGSFSWNETLQELLKT